MPTVAMIEEKDAEGVVRDVYRSIEAELKLRGYDQAVLVH